MLQTEKNYSILIGLKSLLNSPNVTRGEKVDYRYLKIGNRLLIMREIFTIDSRLVAADK